MPSKFVSYSLNMLADEHSSGLTGEKLLTLTLRKSELPDDFSFTQRAHTVRSPEQDAMRTATCRAAPRCLSPSQGLSPRGHADAGGGLLMLRGRQAPPRPGWPPVSAEQPEPAQDAGLDSRTRPPGVTWWSRPGLRGHSTVLQSEQGSGPAPNLTEATPKRRLSPPGRQGSCIQRCQQEPSPASRCQATGPR